jgi:hypothetical protein
MEQQNGAGSQLKEHDRPAPTVRRGVWGKFEPLQASSTEKA